MKEFITINENVTSELVVKKSKFICDLIKVDNVEEAENKIKEIKKKYHDAKHHCVAYRICEEDNLIEKSSDDGEPSGTAGMPMLNILQKNNICNVVVIVTRYFGGILLGTGGLSRAYSDVTLEAINKSTKMNKILCIEIEAKIDYINLEKIKYYCRKNSICISFLDYNEIVECKIFVEEERFDKIIEDINFKIINLIDYKMLGKKYIDKSILKE